MSIFRRYLNAEAPWTGTTASGENVVCNMNFYKGKSFKVISENSTFMEILPSHYRLLVIIELFPFAGWSNNYAYVYFDNNT